MTFNRFLLSPIVVLHLQRKFFDRFSMAASFFFGNFISFESPWLCFLVTMREHRQLCVCVFRHLEKLIAFHAQYFQLFSFALAVFLRTKPHRQKRSNKSMSYKANEREI